MNEHFAVPITEEKRANYKTLAAHLLKVLPEYVKFDMAEFFVDAKGSSLYFRTKDLPECGAVCCALGYSNIIWADERRELDVRDISIQKFGEFNDAEDTPQMMIWDWCFSGSWKQVDNTPQGAAARILYMLEHGIPKNFRKQLYHGEPLSYILVDTSV